MATLSRRTLLQAAAATTGGVVVSGALDALLAGTAGAAPDVSLGPVADLRDGKVRLHLPPRFQYRSFHDTDGPPVVLTDGTTLPGRHDGMAAFRGRRGTVWIVRNHEIAGPVGAFGVGTPYDPIGGGGTTTVELTRYGEELRSFTSLNGTMNNCAGGRMPWDAWITCEETVNGPDVGPDFTLVSNTALQQRHGFIFDVPVGGQSDRRPITQAGRFAHEAAAYSPHEGIVYLTEDNFAFPSGLYRYLPPVNPMRAGALVDGGRLQMLRVVGVSGAHLEAAQTIGASYDVDWVDIADPAPTFPYTPGETAPTLNDDALQYVGNQGRAQGAAGFSRLEGASFTQGEIYFTSTQGGGPAEAGPQLALGYGRGTGQIWSYDPLRNRLTCRYQAPDATALELPDNITSRSDNGALVICEDGPVENYIRRLDRNGSLLDVALNRLRRNAVVPPATEGAPRFGEEFAGATFSPDGHTLFVNIQASQAITFAIWGPWGRLGV
ncbi:MAG: alkaline phosphatase PhoX [Ilumatobacteraceae bacterium]